jgi:hypothetical protein
MYFWFRNDAAVGSKYTILKKLQGKVTTVDGAGEVSVYDTYVPGQPNSHDEETCTACISERQEAEAAMRKRSASLSDSDSGSGSESESEFQLPPIPRMDSAIEDIFASQGLGVEENMEDEDMDSCGSGSESEEDSDFEEVIHKSCSGIQDLLLTGEVRIYLSQR